MLGKTFASMLVLLAGASICGASAGGEAPADHRASLLKDPSLIRYYTFDEASAGRVPNLAGPNAALTYNDDRERPMELVPGRRPGETAVRLDEGYLTCEPFAVENKSFTVETWVRKNGVGTRRGNPGSFGGTILSVGIGYWDGWRLTTSYPERGIGFEIGRAKPSSSFAIATPSVSDSAWHHLAASWDGRRTRIYVDGLLCGEGDYSGEYVTPEPTAQFRVGYAGYGIGSAKLDIAEVAVFSRARSGEQILADALTAQARGSALSRIAHASEALMGGDAAAAASECASVLKTKGLAPGEESAARLTLARAQLALSDPAGAAAEYAKAISLASATSSAAASAQYELLGLIASGEGISLPTAVCKRLLAAKDLSADDRTAVRLCAARSYAASGKHEVAVKEYRATLAEIGRKEPLTSDIHMEIASAYIRSGDLRSARKEYAAILNAGNAPAPSRSIAQIALAETFVRAGDFKGAKAQYAKLQSMPGVPEHHKWEARERVKEIDRIAAGLPTRDPSWSRVKLPKEAKPGLTLYVSPSGSDAADGSKAGPFATIERARDEIRRIKAQKGLPKGGVTVYLRGGTYQARRTVEFTDADSGAEGSPIVYRSFGGEVAALEAGTKVRGFGPVTSETGRERIPAESLGRVMQADLRAQGIAEYGEWAARGFAMSGPPVMELFFDGKPMQPARWPNEGFVRVGNVVQRGAQGDGTGAVFGYDGDRPSRWTKAPDAWMVGYWYYDWAGNMVKIASIDTAQRLITAASTSPYGAQSGQRWYAVNLLEELDAPGEWYVDREAGILYFYPPSDPTKSTVELSMLDGPVIRMTGASHIRIQGLLMEEGRGTGVAVSGGSKCLIAGCTIRRFGGDGVVIDSGEGHGVFGCDIQSLGRGGVVLTGGDRKTLKPGNHFVENCHVSDFSRIDRTYTPAVIVNGVGNRIAHNLFNDAPHQGMRVEGNDHIVEFNEVHSVVYESDDQAGLDIFQNPTYRGNVFRYNLWRNIGSGLHIAGQAGIRLDDAISGCLMYGNVFYRCAGGNFGAIQIHGGKDNIVDNNVIVDCKAGISFTPWGPDRWREYVTTGTGKTLFDEVNASKPPYSSRYPALASLAENPDSNMIWRNVLYNCGRFLRGDRGVNQTLDNYVTAVNPGFADVGKMDFRLKSGSPAYDRIAFRPIPFAEIGLYKHPLRASWPVKREAPHYEAETRP